MTKNNERLNRDTYFIEITKLVAKRSTCNKLSVGAILVYNNRIISTGFNGSPPGYYHCYDIGCDLENNHCQNTIHAELNAILFLKERVSPLTLYATHFPCHRCLQALITIGVNEIVYLEDYFDSRSQKLIDFYHIKMKKFKYSENI